VRATWPGADAEALGALPGVQSVEVRGDSVVVVASDSDAVARHLLTATSARDLEVTARGLEEAFVALTSDPEADAVGTTDQPAADPAARPTVEATR